MISSGAQICDLDYFNIADALIAEYHIISFKDSIYLYSEGIYKDDENLLKRAIISILRNCRLKGKDRFTDPTKQVVFLIESHTAVSEYPFNQQKDMIPVRNGVIKFNSNGTTELIKHSWEHKFSYKLPVNYDSEADASAVINYLKSTGCDIETLLQIPAHVILSKWGMHFKKCYMLKGEKNSGKTIYLNLLAKRLFGKDNCSSIALDELASNTHASFGLVGKLANICDELPRMKLYDLALFKRLTGGGNVSINRKYCDPFEWECDTTFIFAANYYPELTQNDPAFWERWILLGFNESFKIDPTFEERVFTEEFMSAFLNLVIGRIMTIRKDGIRCDSFKLVQERWLNDSDPFYRYISTCLERDNESFIVGADLFNHYKKHCEITDQMPITLNDFGRRIQEFGADHCQRDRKNGYRGFRLKECTPILNG